MLLGDSGGVAIFLSLRFLGADGSSPVPFHFLMMRAWEEEPSFPCLTFSPFQPLFFWASASSSVFCISGVINLGHETCWALYDFIILLSLETHQYIDSGIDPMKENLELSGIIILVVWNVAMEAIGESAITGTLSFSMDLCTTIVQKRPHEISLCQEEESRHCTYWTHNTDQ